MLYVGGTVAGMLFCMYLQSGKIKFYRGASPSVVLVSYCCA